MMHDDWLLYCEMGQKPEVATIGYCTPDRNDNFTVMYNDFLQ